MANKLKSVTFTNFMSFGQNPTTIDLDRSDITLIIGNNQDVGTDGDSRNAAGKSVIFNAIFWCLFDEPISDMKQDELVCLFNKNHMEVSVALEVNNVPYVITRGRKPNKIELLKEGVPFTLDSTRSIDESIRTLLGTNPDIFKNTYLLDVNQAAFMSLKPAPQRDFMEKFLELETLSQRAVKLKSFRANNAVELSAETKNLDNIGNHNTRVRESIKKLEDKKVVWETDSQNDKTLCETEITRYLQVDIAKIIADNDAIDALKVQMDDITRQQNTLRAERVALEYTIREFDEANALVNELDNEIHAWKLRREHNMQGYQTELDKYKNLDIDGLLDMHSELSKLKKELIDKKREGKVLDEKYARLNSQLETKTAECEKLKQGTCPTCKQPFHDVDMVNSREQEIMNIKVDLAFTEKAANKLLEEITDTEALIVSIGTNIVDHPNEMDLRKKKQDILMWQTGLNKVVGEPNPYETQLQKAQVKIADLQDKLIPSQQRLTAVRDKIASLDIEYTEAATKLKIYGNVESRESALKAKSILEHAQEKLKRLNEETNPYIEQIAFQEKSIMSEDDTKLKDLQKIEDHLNILIKLLTDSKGFIRKNIIDSYVPFLNITVNNNLVEYGSMHTLKINGDLEVELFYMDYPVSYGSLSKGEKLRLNFAFSMALRDMKASFGHKFNTMLVDEYFDAGADTEFFKRIFGALTRENRGIFVISHRDELKTLADREMLVTKSGGFSSITFS